MLMPQDKDFDIELHRKYTQQLFAELCSETYWEAKWEVFADEV